MNTIILFVLICIDGGTRLCYSKEHPMPTWEICLKAVSNSKSQIDVEAGDKREDHIGISFYCATPEVSK